jgi:hypothetical protein
MLEANALEERTNLKKRKKTKVTYRKKVLVKVMFNWFTVQIVQSNKLAKNLPRQYQIIEKNLKNNRPMY